MTLKGKFKPVCVSFYIPIYALKTQNPVVSFKEIDAPIPDAQDYGGYI
ncbi:MAG: hypothetical protein KAS40_17390 [Desulfobacterales bacterium]|nr:hypothetical protein [Desulfobacterales bacterium]